MEININDVFEIIYNDQTKEKIIILNIIKQSSYPNNRYQIQWKSYPLIVLDTFFSNCGLYKIKKLEHYNTPLGKVLYEKNENNQTRTTSNIKS